VEPELTWFARVPSFPSRMIHLPCCAVDASYQSLQPTVTRAFLPYRDKVERQGDGEGGRQAPGSGTPRSVRTVERQFEMQKVVTEEDLAILVKAGLNEADTRHSILVARKAVEIAERTGKDLDLQLVARGALFHDLGKALTHSFQHGELGSEIGKSFGLPTSITDIARKHFHGGLSPQEARDLDLPAVDYTPRLLEERIILYADRLVDILTEGFFAFENEQEAEEQFEKIVTTHRAYGKDKLTSARYVDYHREISGLIKQAGIIAAHR
jgi:uncharacterized protein